MLLLNNPFPKNITAFTTDWEVDFAFPDDQCRLSEDQEQYLKRNFVPADQFINIKQVHGNNIVVIDRTTVESYSVQEADGIITNLNNVAIAVRTADCLPIMLYAMDKSVIGVVHAGWKGSLKGIARKMLELFKEHFGVDPRNIQAAFGPCIGLCCYEVGAEFEQHFPHYIQQREGSLYLDLKKINSDQLCGSGVSKSKIDNPGICTCCETNYYSYRREGGEAGRMLTGMMMP